MFTLAVVSRRKPMQKQKQIKARASPLSAALPTSLRSGTLSGMAGLPQILEFEQVPEEQPQEKRRIGRPLGSKNRIKSPEEQLQEIGINPITKLGMLSQKCEKEGATALAMKGYAELAQYVAAKKKSIEITTEPDSPLDQALQLSVAERMLRVQALMEALHNAKT